MEHPEEWPSSINTSRCLQNLYVSKDKLAVKYTGHGTGTKDVGCVQANHCVPRQELAFYFEVTVKDAGERGRICIGLSDSRFPHGRLPGWEANSMGYHADDGHKYYAGNDGAPYGPTFGTNDVVGACINLHKREVFFTKNGKHLGVAFRDVPTIPLFPTVGLHSLNACCVLNFGQSPFRFDIEGYRQAEIDAVAQETMRIPLSAGVCHDIVRQYLVFHGCADTLRVFDNAAGYTATDGASTSGRSARACPEESSLQLRWQLRHLLKQGDLQGAQALIQQHVPHLLAPLQGGEGEGRGTLKFWIDLQTFVELVRRGDVDAAVTFAQQHLAPYRDPTLLQRHVCHPQLSIKEAQAFLEEVVALIAYPDPATCACGWILGQPQRERVADIANRAVLDALVHRHDASNGHAIANGAEEGSAALRPTPRSAFERLLQHMKVVDDEVFESNGQQGPRLNLFDALKT